MVIRAHRSGSARTCWSTPPGARRPAASAHPARAPPRLRSPRKPMRRNKLGRFLGSRPSPSTPTSSTYGPSSGAPGTHRLQFAARLRRQHRRRRRGQHGRHRTLAYAGKQAPSGGDEVWTALSTLILPVRGAPYLVTPERPRDYDVASPVIVARRQGDQVRRRLGSRLLARGTPASSTILPSAARTRDRLHRRQGRDVRLPGRQLPPGQHSGSVPRTGQRHRGPARRRRFLGDRAAPRQSGHVGRRRVAAGVLRHHVVLCDAKERHCPRLAFDRSLRPSLGVRRGGPPGNTFVTASPARTASSPAGRTGTSSTGCCCSAACSTWCWCRRSRWVICPATTPPPLRPPWWRWSPGLFVVAAMAST